jgi:hypothetical protein
VPVTANWNQYEFQTLLLKQKLGYKFDGSQDVLPEDKEEGRRGGCY